MSTVNQNDQNESNSPASKSGSNSFGIGGAIPPQVLPLVMAVVSIACTWLFVQFTRFPSAWLPFAFGALALSTIMRWRFSVFVALGVIIMVELGKFESTNLTLFDLLFVGLGLSYIIFSFRYMDLKTSLGDLIELKPKPNVSNKNRAHWKTLRPFRAGWHWAVAAIVLATLFLFVIDHDRNANFRYRISPNGLRAITTVWLLAIVWFVIETISRLGKRGNGGSMRGRVFARSVFCREMKSELYSIERKRNKLRKRKAM